MTAARNPRNLLVAVTDFQILGPLDVRENGHALDVGGGKQRALLALLLLHAGETVSTDVAIDALWGERPPESAPASLHAYVSRLRRALGRDRLLRNGHGYRLVVEPDELDLTRFEQLLASGRARLEQGDPEGAADTLRSALSLWHGPPLADFTYEPFARPEIERLEELHLDAIENRIDAELALGRDAQLVSELETLVRERPLRERLRGQLMLALYRSGRQADALEVYRRGRVALVDELGLEPSPELQQLERQILTHDPALRAPAARPTAGSTPSRRWLVLAAVGVVAAVAGLLAFVLTRGDSSPAAVPAGPNTIGVIDPGSNRVVASIPVGRHPVGIAYRGGAVWVANTESRTVSRIDPRTHEVTTIGIGRPPTDIVFAGTNVWTGNGSDGTLSEISPVLSQLVGSHMQLPGRHSLVRNNVDALASGAGSLWAAMSKGTILRINPHTRRIVARINAGAAAIAYGASALWALTHEGHLLRIEPRSNRASGDRALGVGYSVALASAGTQVFAAFQPTFSASGSGVVERIDGDSMTPVWSSTPLSSPVALVAADRTVWVTNHHDGGVYRLDAVTGHILRTIRLGGAPAGIAVVGDEVWVTIDRRDS